MPSSAHEFHCLRFQISGQRKNDLYHLEWIIIDTNMLQVQPIPGRSKETKKWWEFFLFVSKLMNIPSININDNKTIKSVLLRKYEWCHKNSNFCQLPRNTRAQLNLKWFKNQILKRPLTKNNYYLTFEVLIILIKCKVSSSFGEIYYYYWIGAKSM